MSKKTKKNRKTPVPRSSLSADRPNNATTASKKPRVLFAAGDADFGYTEGKIWRLARRIKDQLGWQMVAVSNDREALNSARKLGLDAEYIPMDSPGVTVEERLRATDEMIRETAHVHIPGSQLPLWKVIAMDDFLSSLQLYRAEPKVDLRADAILLPMMAIDNNTRGSCGLYTWLVAQAFRQKIPVVGFEVSPLGNKNTLCQLPVDHYAVKSEWSKACLVREGLAIPEQISVLRWEESYLLWPGRDEYIDAYLEHESKAREMLNLPWDEPVIVIPHHVAFIWEVRKILEALSRISFRSHVVIRVDPRTVRRHYHEREIVMESYGKEIRELPHVVIDERVGVGLLLQVADLVISAFAGTTTERAAMCRKPTIICQAMGFEGWQTEQIYWEPVPDKLPDTINSWKEKGWLDRSRMARIVYEVVNASTKAAA